MWREDDPGAYHLALSGMTMSLLPYFDPSFCSPFSPDAAKTDFVAGVLVLAEGNKKLPHRSTKANFFVRLLSPPPSTSLAS